MDKSQPRISANELGKYVFSSPSERNRILRSQKFPRPIIVSRYQPAQCAILRCFQDGRFSEAAIFKELELLQKKPVRTKYEAAVNQANITALRRFQVIRQKAVSPAGEHEIVRRNAAFEREGVIISVRPDILTRNKGENFFAYSKFRLSNHKYSQDASEVVLLVLEMFAQQQVSGGLEFEMARTKLIDCFSMMVFEGHQVSPYKRSLLKKALAQIRSEWPFVSGKN